MVLLIGGPKTFDFQRQRFYTLFLATHTSINISIAFNSFFKLIFKGLLNVSLPHIVYRFGSPTYFSLVSFLRQKKLVNLLLRVLEKMAASKPTFWLFF